MDDIYDKMIDQIEEEHKKRKLAEKALKECVEICESYFKHGYTSDPNNTRYRSIITIVDKYFEANDISNKNKEDNDEDRGIQSEHC